MTTSVRSSFNLNYNNISVRTDLSERNEEKYYVLLESRQTGHCNETLLPGMDTY